MKMLAVVFLAFATFIASFSIPYSTTPAKRTTSAATQAYITTYEETVVLSSLPGQADCGGVAVAPHTILTAKHCIIESSSGEDRTLTLLVNDKPAKAVVVWVSPTDDHAFVQVDMQFKHWAHLGPEAVPGDDVFVWGAPDGIPYMLRRGSVAGHALLSVVSIDKVPRLYTMYDFNGYTGDSGSAVFDTKGRIVGTVTGIYEATDGIFPTGFSLMMIQPYSFTQADLDKLK